MIDYANGNLVEWKTNYAYGADESGWKNLDAQYDNAEEPYGFTGKEEDDEVGLHYFGARYYSSYLARWLGPDPPVVHGGGMSNHFGYGANSPYIYVDPDGNNPIGAIIGAVIGAIVGGISGGVQAAKNGESVFGGVIWGAYKGASIGAAAGGGGPWAAAGAATAFNQAEMAYRRGGGSRRLMMTFGLVGAAISGGDIGMTQGFALIGAVVGNATSPEFHKASAITFGTSVVSGYVGAGINAGISSPAGSAIAGWGGSLAVTYASAGITGTLNRENADDLFLSSSASYWGSYAGSAVGGEIATIGKSSSEEESSLAQPALNGDGSYQPTRRGQISDNLQMLSWRGRGVKVILTKRAVLPSGVTYYDTGTPTTLSSVDDTMDLAWRLSFSGNRTREVAVFFTYERETNSLTARIVLGKWGSGMIEHLPSAKMIDSPAYRHWGELVAVGHTHPGGASRYYVNSFMTAPGKRLPVSCFSQNDVDTFNDYNDASNQKYGHGVEFFIKYSREYGVYGFLE